MEAMFPRTVVGGISLPRLLIGSNWFLGYSHTSLAQDNFIKNFQTREKISTIIDVFMEYGIDAVMGPVNPVLEDAIRMSEDKAGHKIIRIYTPWFNVNPGGPEENDPELVMDTCAKWNATFCMPHQAVTDALVDRRAGIIRDIDKYTSMIRDRGMIPGLSTHMPETVIYADKQNADVESYIQLYNAAGFLMQVEADWIMNVIRNAKKPVMTIKPLAAGRLMPIVGFSFVWSTIRPIDMVTIGTTTPEEARECIEISLDLLNREIPEYELQKTRSKKSLS